jgi:putative DNA methylase
MIKKLIEVALPLEAINQESAREKSIRHGHPSTLHLWWARRPLAACRAVLFASLVDDPASHPDKFPTEADQAQERQRLFDIIGKIVTVDKKGKPEQVVKGLVSWDSINNREIIETAQKEIARCLAWSRTETPPTEPAEVRTYLQNYAPPVYDPFCGGGSIPLEGQRLGLVAHGSDINPVAVLITKALIEIPPKFQNQPPVNPEAQTGLKTAQWYGAQGLAADVRYYGAWMRDQAFKTIGHLYPKVSLPQEHGGGEARVIAWLWARTVKCPNPGCGAQMPLVKSFELSTKKGKQAWVEPVIDTTHQPPRVSFTVKTGEGTTREGTVNRRGAVCVCCDSPVTLDHIRQEGKAGRMKAQLMAIVAEGQKQRLYIPPNQEQIKVALSAEPQWKPEAEIVGKAAVSVPLYGMPTYGDLFTPRQLVALTTFSDLVSVAREQVKLDAVAGGMADDNLPLSQGGMGATAYADAVATYLGLGVSRSANTICSLAIWSQSRDQSVNVFSRQALPMNWDFPEVNPFAGAAGDFSEITLSMSKTIASLTANKQATVLQHNAAQKLHLNSPVISTDPPYYDNIGYADLADFFYVWLRRSIGKLYPQICSTLLVPKTEELVATPYRFGGDKQKAQDFFETGLGAAFRRMRETAHPEYPVTIYYAFKQSETETSKNNESVTASTGWETMLEGLIQAGFTIVGTWPMRTERPTGVKVAINALASSIVLVCRPREETAPSVTRRQFLQQLKGELPDALEKLQQGNIAPVDLAQASIGPGMGIFSRYTKVLDADGSAIKVRTALQFINQMLDEYLTEQEGEFDLNTRWALIWFEQHQFNEGLYGEAETLSKAKNISVEGLVNGGILSAEGGKVRLLRRGELPENCNLMGCNWLITQHLIYTLDKKGETGAAAVLSEYQGQWEILRDLSYRLYNICDKKGWTQEATAYNSLVISWGEICRLAAQSRPDTLQGELF